MQKRPNGTSWNQGGLRIVWSLTQNHSPLRLNSSKTNHKRSKVGSGPIPGKSPPFPEIVRIFPPLVSDEITYPINTYEPQACSQALSWSTFCLWNVFRSVNMPLLFFGSILNSFLHEAEDPPLAVACPSDPAGPRTWHFPPPQHLLEWPWRDRKGHSLAPLVGLQLPWPGLRVLRRENQVAS